MKSNQKKYTATEVAEMFKVNYITIRRYIEKIKKYRLEIIKKYYGDVLEMNY